MSRRDEARPAKPTRRGVPSANDGFGGPTRVDPDASFDEATRVDPQSAATPDPEGRPSSTFDEYTRVDPGIPQTPVGLDRMSELRMQVGNERISTEEPTAIVQRPKSGSQPGTAPAAQARTKPPTAPPPARGAVAPASAVSGPNARTLLGSASAATLSSAGRAKAPTNAPLPSPQPARAMPAQPSPPGNSRSMPAQPSPSTKSPPSGSSRSMPAQPLPSTSASASSRAMPTQPPPTARAKAPTNAPPGNSRSMPTQPPPMPRAKAPTNAPPASSSRSMPAQPPPASRTGSPTNAPRSKSPTNAPGVSTSSAAVAVASGARPLVNVSASASRSMPTQPPPSARSKSPTNAPTARPQPSTLPPPALKAASAPTRIESPRSSSFEAATKVEGSAFEAATKVESSAFDVATRIEQGRGAQAAGARSHAVRPVDPVARSSSGIPVGDPAASSRPALQVISHAAPRGIGPSANAPSAASGLPIKAPPPSLVPGSASSQGSQPLRIISMKTPAEIEAEQRALLPVKEHRVQIRDVRDIRKHHVTPPQGLGHLAPPRDERGARSRRNQDMLIWGSVIVIVGSIVTLAIWLLAR